MGEGKELRQDNLFDPARKRRRQWFLVVVLLLLCLFALGYSRLEVRQERIRAVIQPTMQLEGRPPATEDLGLLAQANVDGEKVSMSPESSSPSLKESCDDLRVLVDRSHPLPLDYVPEDLVSLWTYEIPTLGGSEMLLRRKAAEHLSSLRRGGEWRGVGGRVGLPLLRGAAGLARQVDERLRGGRRWDERGTWPQPASARYRGRFYERGRRLPDLDAIRADERLLVARASRLGVRIRSGLSKRQREQTGYQWEPWHYRYVGAEDAKRLEKSDLSLQEFLEHEVTTSHC